MDVDALGVWSLVVMNTAIDHLEDLRVLVSLAAVAVIGFVIGRLLPD